MRAMYEMAAERAGSNTAERPTASDLPTPRLAMLRILLLETHAECMRLLRAPAFSVPVLGFPILFYLLFGIALGTKQAGAGGGRAVLATFLVFGVMAPGLFGFGVTLATDRDRGLLALKRALPMPPGAYLVAKLAMAMVFSAVISLLLLTLSLTLGHVALAFFEGCALVGLAILGVLPFCGLGLLIGTCVKGQAAAAVINLVYFPMAFLSGLFIPLSLLPHALAQLAPLWPAYQLLQLALEVVERPIPDAVSGAARHALVLAGMTVLLFAIARRRLRRKG